MCDVCGSCVMYVLCMLAISMCLCGYDGFMCCVFVYVSGLCVCMCMVYLCVVCIYFMMCTFGRDVCLCM